MRFDQSQPTDEQQPIKQSFCRSLRRDTHWKCLILTLLISGCLTAIAWCRMTTVTHVVVNNLDYMPMTRTSRASPCEDGYVYIPVAFTVMLYLVYLVECWHCHTRIELQYKVDVNTVYERVQTMREALPIVWWKAICYHYVRRTRQVTRYRNGDAFTTTQVYYERVNSHTSSSAFNFLHCGIKDVSRKLVSLEQYPATKIHFSKGFSFSCVQAEHEYEDQRGEFFQEHERRDDYMETREGLDLLNVNFKEYMIAFADPDNLPWYVSQIVFWLASVLLMSWPLRVLIEFKTAYVHFHVHKIFGGNYMDPAFCPGQMTRVSTMGSSELELSIRNNYMVPSYSEALLMDSSCPTRDRNANITPSASSFTINGYIPLAGASSPTMQLNSVLLGSLPAGLANGHFQNGHIASVHSANGSVPPTRFIRRSWSAMEQVQMALPQQRRRGRRKRKRRRHSYTEATQPGQADCEPSLSASYTPTIASTPESPNDYSSVTLLPSTNSIEEVEREGQEAGSERSTSVSPTTEETAVEEDPPSYEVALTMSLPPSTHSSPAREPRISSASPHAMGSPRLTRSRLPSSPVSQSSHCSGSPLLPASPNFPLHHQHHQHPGSPHMIRSPLNARRHSPGGNQSPASPSSSLSQDTELPERVRPTPRRNHNPPFRLMETSL